MTRNVIRFIGHCILLFLYASSTATILLPAIDSTVSQIFICKMHIIFFFVLLLLKDHARFKFRKIIFCIIHAGLSIVFCRLVKTCNPKEDTRLFPMFLVYLYYGYTILFEMNIPVELITIANTFGRVCIIALPYMAPSLSGPVIQSPAIKDAIVVSLLIDGAITKLVSYVKKYPDILRWL